MNAPLQIVENVIDSPTTDENDSFFLSYPTISVNDMYSGMWWTTMSSFLNIPTEKMNNLEAATFHAIDRNNILYNLRMVG